MPTHRTLRIIGLISSCALLVVTAGATTSATEAGPAHAQAAPSRGAQKIASTRASTATAIASTGTANNATGTVSSTANSATGTASSTTTVASGTAGTTALLTPTLTATSTHPSRASSTPTRTVRAIRANPTATRTPRPTLTATRTPRPTPSATHTPRPTPTATRAPRPTATPRPTPTPNPHPGYGAVPWKVGEYYVWKIDGVSGTGTAYQLFTIAGHEWIDNSASARQITDGDSPTDKTPSNFTSRLAFDVNTYLLRRYDAVEDYPISVLRATLFGPHLDYTSYHSWGQFGCTVVHRLAPPDTMAFGMMLDLARTLPLRPGMHVFYNVFDPYSKSLIVRAHFDAIRYETLHTILGTVQTVHIAFHEGTEPELDVWYTTTRAHVVVKWGTPGSFGATLVHYEPHSTRTALPMHPLTVELQGKDRKCM